VKAMRLFSLPIFIIVFSLAVFGQAEKYVLIDSNAFEDEKKGINKLASIVETVIKDFSETGMGLYDLQRSIDKLSDEIKDVKKAEKPIAEKELRIKQLIDLLEKSKKEREAAFEITLAKTTNPIRKQIKQKLVEFAKKNGYSIVFDVAIAKYSETIFAFWIDDSINITEDFVKFCNEEFEKEKLTNK
jgi:Skp family chaperone for outer membrane proteins